MAKMVNLGQAYGWAAKPGEIKHSASTFNTDSSKVSAVRTPGGGGGSGLDLGSLAGQAAGLGGVGSVMPGSLASFSSKGGSNNNALIQKLIESLTGSQDETNKVNEEQYKAILGKLAGVEEGVLGAAGSFAQAESLMGDMGKSATKRVMQQRERDLAQAEQDLISRGLGNTTVRSSVRRGISADAESALQDIDEQVAAQKAGLLTQKAGAQLDVGRLGIDTILSRSNEGPNVAQYLQLLQQLAR